MKVEIEADVPEGYRAVACRPPKGGESYCKGGHPYVADFDMISERLIIEADNPPKLDAPEGYEHTGECRVPTGDDVWADPLSSSSISFNFKNCAGPGGSYGNRRWILRKKWTPPAEFPEGWWLYRAAGVWYLSPPETPPLLNIEGRVVSPLGRAWIHADAVAIRGKFTPPPADKIQVKHGKN